MGVSVQAIVCVPCGTGVLKDLGGFVVVIFVLFLFCILALILFGQAPTILVCRWSQMVFRRKKRMCLMSLVSTTPDMQWCLLNVLYVKLSAEPRPTTAKKNFISLSAAGGDKDLCSLGDNGKSGLINARGLSPTPICPRAWLFSHTYPASF